MPSHEGHELLLHKGDVASLHYKLLVPVWHRRPAHTVLLVVSGAGTLLFFSAYLYSVFTGVGLWGNNNPVHWGYPIINFVWWVGIGHAGTFISAILLVFQQKWRNSINRLAEAMTLFAIIQAGLMPLLHLGRMWFNYWLVPYPSTTTLWPQFKSALPWDFGAILTYFIVSLIFWYTGLIPDLAAVRDSAPGRRRRQIYGLLALGWRGTGRQWRVHKGVYGLMGGLATALVVSVHSIVSFDFAIALLPGWHSTIFPPYYVLEALFSGFAMVSILACGVRWFWGLHDVITRRHLDMLGIMTLILSWGVCYSLTCELFAGWYSATEFDRFMYFDWYPFGEYWPAYWGMWLFVVVVPQIFWFRRARQSPWLLSGVGVLGLIGIWVEQWMIVINPLSRDFLPSSWHAYWPTIVDASILVGSISFFFFLFLLFLRYVPFIPVHEVKELRHELKQEEEP